MIENKEIIPGRGVGNVLLGMQTADVENVLGKPDDVEKIDYDDGESSTTWYYFDLELDLSFESVDEGRLSFISVESKEFVLGGKIKIGQTKEHVLDICKELGYSAPEIEDLSSDDVPNQELASFEKEGINLWFTEGRLDEIQFGPFWKDDETPIWPQ